MESSCAWYKIVTGTYIVVHCVGFGETHQGSVGNSDNLKPIFGIKMVGAGRPCIGCVRNMGHEDGFYLHIHICTYIGEVATPPHFVDFCFGKKINACERLR